MVNVFDVFRAEYLCMMFLPVCLCSPGGLAAEEPGQCSERGPLWSHPHTEEKAPEHPELHTSSA